MIMYAIIICFSPFKSLCMEFKTITRNKLSNTNHFNLWFDNKA